MSMTTREHYPCQCHEPFSDSFDPCGHGDTARYCPKHSAQDWVREEWDQENEPEPVNDDDSAPAWICHRCGRAAAGLDDQDCDCL